MRHFVYILRCRDGTFYTGYTVDIDKRCIKHNSGKGAKYTRSRLPVRLVYWMEFDTKPDAMKYEYEVKQLSRKEKIKLLRYSN